MEPATTKSAKQIALLPRLVQTLTDDPLLTNILFSILRNPGITAKELEKNFSQTQGDLNILLSEHFECQEFYHCGV